MRKSMKGEKPKKLHAGMIGAPQNDLRHTGHIGYDGAMFGDVSFIGDQYDKLPVKVVTPCKLHSTNLGGQIISYIILYIFTSHQPTCYWLLTYVHVHIHISINIKLMSNVLFQPLFSSSI